MALPLTNDAWPLAWVRMTGLFGRNLVEGVVEGEALDVRLGRLAPFGLMPAAADDPLAGFGLLDGARDLGDDLVPRAGFAEVEAHAELAEAGEVAVSLDEAGDGGHAVEVDDLGAGADPFGGVGVAAHAGDGFAADGERLDDGSGGAHGDDLAVAEDEVGGLPEGGRRRQKQQGQAYAHRVRILPFGGRLDLVPAILFHLSVR